jgi:hypothetical protein
MAALANASGASWGRLWPTPPSMVRCEQVPENFWAGGPALCRWRRPGFASASGQPDWPVGALTLGQIHIGLEGIKGQVGDAFGHLRIPVAGAFHSLQHRDRGVLRRCRQVGVEGVVKVRDLLLAAFHQLPGLPVGDGLAAGDRRPDTVQRLAKHTRITPARSPGEPRIGRQEPLTAQRGKADPSPGGQPLELGPAIPLIHRSTSHDRRTGRGWRSPASYRRPLLPCHRLAHSSGCKVTRPLTTLPSVEPVMCSWLLDSGWFDPA